MRGGAERQPHDDATSGLVGTIVPLDEIAVAFKFGLNNPSAVNSGQMSETPATYWLTYVLKKAASIPWYHSLPM